MFLSCSDSEELIYKPDIDIDFYIGLSDTGVDVSGVSYNIDRALIIPFRKTGEGVDDTNFIPDYSYVTHKTIAQGGVADVKLHLMAGAIYKVLVVGYKNEDYTPAISSNNRFVLGGVSDPVSLANYAVKATEPNNMPEVFACICEASLNGSSIGEAFAADENISISGNLKRLVSGISLTIENVPKFVTSVSLISGNLIEASRLTDAMVMTARSEESILEVVVPSDNKISFFRYLLAGGATYSTSLSLDILVGGSTKRYLVRVPDSETTTNNTFIFYPNQIIKVTGDYSKIDVGFTLTHMINLDDDGWDGNP